uniref:Uncharacterized protein n=1 Tax=Anguilla anguilla TaxID=7936 RepID=A0A0E9WDS2_ANGAN
MWCHLKNNGSNKDTCSANAQCNPWLLILSSVLLLWSLYLVETVFIKFNTFHTLS